MPNLFTNFARAKLATPPSGTSGLVFTVESGKGNLFPITGGSNKFYVCFKNAAKTSMEIVRILSRGGDAFTIDTGSRGLDGTTAQTWTANDFIELIPNAAALQNFAQKDETPQFSAGLGVSLGTVSAPSIAATGDPNTGMWFPAADTVAISTGGSERVRVNSSGNVGVGVTPTARLHVGQGDLQVGENTDATSRRVKWQNSTTNWNMVQDVATLTLDNNGTVRTVWDASGNVGIGAVPGATGATGRLEVHTGNGTAARFMLGQTGVANYSLQIPASTDRLDIVYGNSTIRATLESNGNLAIGRTTANGYRLAIDGSDTSASIAFAHNAASPAAWVGFSSQFGGYSPGVAYSFRNDAVGGSFVWGFSGSAHMHLTNALFRLNAGFGSIADAFVARAWVNFDGATGTKRGSGGNVGTVTRSGTGVYSVPFTVAMPDTNYCATITAMGSGSTRFDVTDVTYATGSIAFTVRDSAGVAADATFVNVQVHR